MNPTFEPNHDASEGPIGVVIERIDLADWPRRQSELESIQQAQLVNGGFEAKNGAHALVYGAEGGLERVLYLRDGAKDERFGLGRLAKVLPRGTYRLAGSSAKDFEDCLAFLLACYRFDKYRARAKDWPRLIAPATVDAGEVERIAKTVFRARDLINRPANDLGPQALEDAFWTLSAHHGARIEVVRGEALLAHRFPLVHAVGRAGEQAPRLVDLRWGDDHQPFQLTLVGKGVCFDSGGLDIKPSAAMALMKKDMGGAAAALAAADMIMGANLPLRLRLIVPIVENAISSLAFRPGDVFFARNGVSVEIGNTDAEGRLILADALSLAGEAASDLVIDFATLTGAARVALGPEIPAYFTPDDALAAEIARIGEATNDPVWRLPLWGPYERLMKSKIADVNNAGAGGFAGAITAALFLQRFIGQAKQWAHFDLYGWNVSDAPGRPEGGEVQAARLVYALARARCGLGS